MKKTFGVAFAAVFLWSAFSIAGPATQGTPVIAPPPAAALRTLTGPATQNRAPRNRPKLSRSELEQKRHAATRQHAALSRKRAEFFTKQATRSEARKKPELAIHFRRLAEHSQAMAQEYDLLAQEMAKH